MSSMFNRQPALPPSLAHRGGAESTRRPSAPPRPAEPLGHFAIVGVDQLTHEVISTVIEARSEDDAQRIAQQKGIVVDEFKPMHPLAGAAALELARNDPRDRFNQPAHLDDLPPPPPAASRCSDSGSVGRPSMQDTAFSPRKRPARRGPLGSLGVAAVLALAGGVFYVTAVRDGGLQQTLISLLPGPASAHAAEIDLDAPVGVNLAEVQGFDDWQYVNDLTTTPAADHRTADATPGRTLRLEAIIPATRAAGGHRGSAVIGGQIVRPGQAIAGYRLVLVRDKHVLLQKGDRLIALRMAQDPIPTAPASTTRPPRPDKV